MNPRMRLNIHLPMGRHSHRRQIRSSFSPVASRGVLVGFAGVKGVSLEGLGSVGYDWVEVANLVMQ